MAGLNLRGENAKFGGCTLGLCAPGSDDDFAGKIRDFFSREPMARAAVVHLRHCTRPVALHGLDLTRVVCAADGSLLELAPMLDPEIPAGPDPGERANIESAIVRAVNATLALSSLRRPSEILRRISCEFRGRAERDYAGRILQGAFLAFEKQWPDRFTPPDPWVFRHPGSGLMFFTARRHSTGIIDLWTQVHHAPVDGAPLQKMFRRFQRATGVCEQVVFPAPDGPMRRTSCVNEGRELVLMNGFFDFAPVRVLQQKLNEQFKSRLSGSVNFGAVLLWCLAHQPVFSNVRFSFLVLVPPDENFGEGIDYVVIRPQDFVRPDMPDRGFLDYARDFLLRMNEARTRRSRSFRTMKNMAQLPAAVAQAAIRLNVRARQRSSGTLMVTFLPTTSSAMVPMSDVGFEHGIIGIYNLELPSAGGGRVGAVGIKGDPGVVEPYPAALQRALAHALDYLPAGGF